MRQVFLIVFRMQPDGRWLIIEHVWTDKMLGTKE